MAAQALKALKKYAQSVCRAVPLCVRAWLGESTLEELQAMCKTKATTEEQHFSITIFKDTSAWHMFSGFSSRFYEDPSDASVCLVAAL